MSIVCWSGDPLPDRLLERDANPATKEIDHRLIARLTIGYLMTMIREVMRVRQGDFVDVLICWAILHGNGETERGVSRNAISKMLDMPLETARRRVNRLVQKGTLVEQPDGLVFSFDDVLKPGQRTPLDELNLQKLRELVRTLKAHGVDLD
jgi:hypothetical protein